MTATVRRSRLSSEREAELYQAVIDLVREVGYEAMTMDAVAARIVLVPRFGPKPVVPLGMGLAAAGMALLTGLGMGSGYASAVLPALLITGLGLGLVMPRR
jgi:hypothetical protein